MILCTTFHLLHLITSIANYSSVSINRVYLIIVLSGFSQLTCDRVVSNNRVEWNFFCIRAKTDVSMNCFVPYASVAVEDIIAYCEFNVTKYK